MTTYQLNIVSVFQNGDVLLCAYKPDGTGTAFFVAKSTTIVGKVIPGAELTCEMGTLPSGRYGVVSATSL